MAHAGGTSELDIRPLAADWPVPPVSSSQGRLVTQHALRRGISELRSARGGFISVACDLRTLVSDPRPNLRAACGAAVEHSAEFGAPGNLRNLVRLAEVLNSAQFRGDSQTQEAEHLLAVAAPVADRLASLEARLSKALEDVRANRDHQNAIGKLDAEANRKRSKDPVETAHAGHPRSYTLHEELQDARAENLALRRFLFEAEEMRGAQESIASSLNGSGATLRPRLHYLGNGRIAGNAAMPPSSNDMRAETFEDSPLLIATPGVHKGTRKAPPMSNALAVHSGRSPRSCYTANMCVQERLKVTMPHLLDNPCKGTSTPEVSAISMSGADGGMSDVTVGDLGHGVGSVESQCPPLLDPVALRCCKRTQDTGMARSPAHHLWGLVDMVGGKETRTLPVGNGRCSGAPLSPRVSKRGGHAQDPHARDVLHRRPDLDIWGLPDPMF